MSGQNDAQTVKGGLNTHGKHKLLQSIVAVSFIVCNKPRMGEMLGNKYGVFIRRALLFKYFHMLAEGGKPKMRLRRLRFCHAEGAVHAYQIAAARGKIFKGGLREAPGILGIKKAFPPCSSKNITAS